MPSIVEFVQQAVQPKEYWESVFDGVRWSEGVEARVKSPFRSDRNPSMTINPDSGKWFDHGSDEGGNSIVSFHAILQDVTHREAAEDLFATFVHPVIDPKRIRSWARTLRDTPSFTGYIAKKRLVSDAVRDQFCLGTTGSRITIPVKNEFGLTVNAKLYLPGGKPKMLNYKQDDESRSYGSPTMLFPLSVLDNTTDEDPIVICEGEWDVLALLSIGVMAVSGTAGCKAWPKQYNELFRGRRVFVAYDNDEEGEKYHTVPVRNLSKVAKSVARIRIPQSAGKDVTDWMTKDAAMRRLESWEKLFADAEPLVDNPDSYISQEEAVPVALDMASQAAFYGKRIQVAALVTGKDTAPYILPRKIRVSCSKTCEECPLAESAKPFRDKELNPSDPTVLEMVDVPKAQLKRTLLTVAGMPCKPACRSTCEILESFNIEQLLLIPSLDDKKSQYVMRPSYYVGHGLHSNRTYRFEGTTTTDPTDQHATHLFDRAVPVQDEIETFELDDVTKRALRRFQATKPSVRSVMNRLISQAEWQSRNVTKIRQREDLHIAVDLVFHSVAALDFNGERIKRGMLDVLILGDTRCGKGFVTEGLVKYYRLGEVASGENCSFAGLVGGCENIGKRFIVKWGIVPLNNGRLVVIDEASALSEEEFGHMSRVRSEGIAEISKIVREQTQANTRLLWLSNTRSGRGILSYNTGVQAVKELVGANEDISRFDFALTVATNEVESATINTVSHSDTHDADRYPPELCRALVLWAWSRTPDQISFTSEATEEVIRQAVVFGKTYSPTIPLVQAENVRVKIAKISAAVAARVFSTDETSSRLLVDKCHVEVACQFVRQIYSKNSMGYDTYSEMANQRDVLTTEAKDAVLAAMKKVHENVPQIMRGLLVLHHISLDSLSDYLGDTMSTKNLISDLVLHNCITQEGRWYLKTPAFSAWLRDHQRKIAHG